MTNSKDVKRISFSALKNWSECPHRHKLIYVDKLPHFSGNEYTAFGTAIHEVCEEIVPVDSANPIEVFKRAFSRELNTLKDQGHDLNTRLVSEMMEQAIPICDQVLPAVRTHFGKFQVVSVEEEILEPISEFESFGTSFKGFIDMVIKTEDDKYHIIDWKTCSWGWSRDKKSDPIISSQLTYYKNYFAKKHNINPKVIETYFVLLKRTAKKENVEVLRMTSGPKKTSNSLKVLQNAVINIERGNYIKNRLSCKYCKFHKTEYCK
jgi:ATP-dependent exoDNAse (exonuclease V) beta subunit